MASSQRTREELERAGVLETSDHSGHVSESSNNSRAQLDEQVNALMGKVTDVLMGDGLADGQFADELMDRLAQSLGGYPQSQRGMYGNINDSMASHNDYHGEGGATAGPVYFDDPEGAVGFDPHPKEEEVKQKKKEGVRLREWEENHDSTYQARHEKQKMRTLAKTQKLAKEDRAAEMETKRKSRVLAEHCGWDIEITKEDPSKFRKLADWKKTFGARLERYADDKETKLKTLQKKIDVAKVESTHQSKGPKLQKTDDGRLVWEDGVVCTTEGVREVLEDDRWVYKRLMQNAKKTVRNKAIKQNEARKQRAIKELEECYFEPQLKSARKVPAGPKVSDPLRQLGYEPRPYHGRAQQDEYQHTFIPAINPRSRQMVDPAQYASMDEVSARLATPATPRARKTEDDDESEDQPTFQPNINRRSHDMHRDVDVYDRLYGIGMQQMLEKRRMQGEFWRNYTTVDAPTQWAMPDAPLAYNPYQTSMDQSAELKKSGRAGSTSRLSEAGPNDSIRQAGASPFAGADKPLNQAPAQVSRGMSPAEFLAMYSTSK